MARPRSNAEIKSQLPTYEVDPSEDYPDWLIVTCPREDCGNKFLVKTEAWYEERISPFKQTVMTGRACPYCYKTGLLPQHP